MSILRSPEGGPLEVVTIVKEYQHRGASHWHMFWAEPRTAPLHAGMAEMPRLADISDVKAAYLSYLKTCYRTRHAIHPVATRTAMGRCCISASMSLSPIPVCALA